MEGQRNEFGKKHGVVRDLLPFIKEGTYKNGRRHGIQVTYFNDGELSVNLFKNGNKIASCQWRSDWTFKKGKNQERIEAIFSVDQFMGQKY